MLKIICLPFYIELVGIIWYNEVVEGDRMNFNISEDMKIVR